MIPGGLQLLRAEFLESFVKTVSRLWNNARNYAIEKMKYEASSRGANAIIGIDSESSMASADITHGAMHVTI